MDNIVWPDKIKIYKSPLLTSTIYAIMEDICARTTD